MLLKNSFRMVAGRWDGACRNRNKAPTRDPTPTSRTTWVWVLTFCRYLKSAGATWSPALSQVQQLATKIPTFKCILWVLSDLQRVNSKPPNGHVLIGTKLRTCTSLDRWPYRDRRYDSLYFWPGEACKMQTCHQICSNLNYSMHHFH